MTANYLHPLYKKAFYSNNLIPEVKVFLTHYARNNFQNINALKAFISYSDEKPGLYSQFLNMEDVCKDPVLFWEMCKEENYDLNDLALKLIRIPCNLPKISETRDKNYEMSDNEQQVLSSLKFDLLLNGNFS